MNFAEINNPKILTSNLQSNDERLIATTLNWLISEYKEKFKGVGKNVCRRWPASKNKEDEITELSFWDGLHSFFEKIKKDGFEDRGIPVSEVFKAFFLTKLKGQLITAYRESLRRAGKDPDEIFKNLKGEISICYQPGEENEEYAQKEMLFKKAYNTLKANCRNLIEWRKLLKLKKEVVATRLGLQTNSVNNELHKCIKYLKKIVSN